MRIRAPRWLLILEGVLLLGALAVLSYKAAMWIRPLEGLNKTPHARKVDPEKQVHQYYREYPDSYVRIAGESWRYSDRSRIATHTLTLKNAATVPYHDIEIKFSYESAGGKVLFTHVAKIPGILAASTSLEVSELRVTGVPEAAVKAVASVVKAVPLER
jgi:hypothetical protein